MNDCDLLVCTIHQTVDYDTSLGHAAYFAGFAFVEESIRFSNEYH